MTEKARIRARVIMYGAVFFGRISLLAFTLFLFIGPFGPAKTDLSLSGWLIRDAWLSLLFFIQHSGMIRRYWRAKMADLIPDYYYGAVFTIASSVALALMVMLWKPSGVLLVGLSGPARWVARGVFFAAAAGIVWGIRSLKGFDPFGMEAVKAALAGKSIQDLPIRIQGPYLGVRHPLYFFVLVMMWACPDLSADRLFFNVAWSLWIWGGAFLEEKDLLVDFGEDYRRYQRQVPMLIPWKGFPWRGDYRF